MADAAPVDTARQDGSDLADRLLKVIGAAADRRTASDELAAGITDWATRHHLSRLRANAVRPVRLGPGTRVLDVAGESGALARTAAESGADVVCLSGSTLMAQAAEIRCDGLERVAVLPLAVEAYDDPDGFDVVLCMGALEASPHPYDLLGRLGRLTRPDGVLLIGVDNPVGVQCLLGYDEHRFGAPWAGVTGGPAASGSRAFTAKGLRALLNTAGFGAQRWLLPFPDWRLATSLLDAQIYDDEDAADLVDQLVRWPCRRDLVAPLRICDDRVGHRTLVEAALGPDVGNSFLVVCGRSRGAVDAVVDPGTRAWVFSGDRKRRFLGWKSFGADPADPVSAFRVDDEEPARSAWLSQVRPPSQVRRAGRTMEQLALLACQDGEAAVGAVLRRWREHLRGVESDAGRPGDEPHPFRTRRTTSFLPADHLDVNLPNFVADAGGRLHYVDDEWRAPSPVDADLVCTRALWWFAVDIVHRGVVHPWPLSASVDELTRLLAGCAGQAPVDLDDLRTSEAALQAKVSGRSLEHWRDSLTVLGLARPTDPFLARRLPVTSLRATAAGLAAQVAELSWRLDEVEDRNRALVADAHVHLEEGRAREEQLRDLRQQLDAATGRAASAERDMEVLAAQLAAAREEMAEERRRRREAQEELDKTSSELAALRRSPLFALYRRLAGRERP